MKTLNYNGLELEYKITHGSYGDAETKFYKGSETITYKQFGLFGKIITVTEPKHIFTIYHDIEYSGYSKERVRGWITEKISIMKRKEEINRGEII